MRSDLFADRPHRLSTITTTTTIYYLFHPMSISSSSSSFLLHLLILLLLLPTVEQRDGTEKKRKKGTEQRPFSPANEQSKQFAIGRVTGSFDTVRYGQQFQIDMQP
uniref:Uncharacterized protein n=1 Tax=Onchocerca volvulus TaxID=6282 RepID=A0A8R1TVV0_ONCVO